MFSLVILHEILFLLHQRWAWLVAPPSSTFLCLSFTLAFQAPWLLWASWKFQHLNCGSSGNSFDGDRSWRGDINTKLLTLQDNYQSVTAQTPSTALPTSSHTPQLVSLIHNSPIPFMRLFFYPGSYLSFNRPNALFTVKCGGFTLLKDFNVSLTIDANNANPTGTTFREYIIHVRDDHQMLNLTFTPSTSHPNSCAFINGIEVVTMPTYLYYTDPNDFNYHQIMFVGYPSTPFPIGNNTALETHYLGVDISLQSKTRACSDRGKVMIHVI